MQVIKLIHNPSAGDEEHTKDKLVEQIESKGFECRYSSTKDNDWKEFKDADIIAIAGGDGTVRKVVKRLLKKNGKKYKPLALLPLGTANNIAKTFNISLDTAQVIGSWKTAEVRNIDIGLVENVPNVEFFLEGFGFGIFPFLMKEMGKDGKEYPSPDEELNAALKKLHSILHSYTPRQCHLEVDGTDHSGKFYMVEVMNIKSIGPNMILAPMADPGDGELEVVLVPEAHKDKFSDFLLHNLTNSEEVYQFHVLRGKNISIHWEGNRLHADDEMVKLEKSIEINLRIKEGALQFLVPTDESANR